MKYATQEWLNRQTELQQAFSVRSGASARVQYRLTQSPDGTEIRYYANVVDGRAVEQSIGEDPSADGTMSSSYDDSIAIMRGELSPNTAFMQGRVKLTGKVAKLAALMPITQTAEYREHYAQLSKETES